MIDDSVDSLVNNSPEDAAFKLVELAKMWANAGMSQQSFADVRKYIIIQAELKTDIAFIREKLKIAEQLIREARNVTNIQQAH